MIVQPGPAQPDPSLPIPPAPATGDQSQSPPPALEGVEKKRVERFRSRVEAAKTNGKRYHAEWKGSVERRLGNGAKRYTEGLATDGDYKSEINPDWSLTKTKTAHLFSQVPVVQGEWENSQYAGAVPSFLKSINYEVSEKRMHMGAAMEECMNDAVNASGIAGLMVGYAARFTDIEMPEADSLPGPNGPIPVSGIPPDKLQIFVQVMKSQGVDVPMRTVKHPTDYRFFAKRISPVDLLWPAEFAGSNFDDADWLGYRDRCSWPDAMAEFDLKADQKEAVLASNSDDSSTDRSLRSDSTSLEQSESEVVKFDVIYYKRSRVDEKERSFSSIWKLVFVQGIDEPVVHKQWEGQKYIEGSGKYVGACRYPLRVLTLTYITDNAIPPSDSAAGRPQVDDLRRSRSQYFKNRHFSTPLRWYDVNRIDRPVQDLLMRGNVQGMIPTNGDGSRAIGEIARASYPSENMAFDQTTQADLERSWQVGADQSGGYQQGRRTGTEANIIQQNFSTRMGQERARVAEFFLSAIEVLAGWMCLYSDFPNLPDQERQQMQSVWDMKSIPHDIVLNILPDSTVVLDTQAKIDRIAKFLNLTGKSGYVNPKPLIIEMALLSGIDPSKVVVDPQPHEEKPNISLRLSGKDDLQNAMAVAILIAQNAAPTPQQIEQAKQILTMAAAPPAPPGLQPAGAIPGQGGPGGPPSPGGPPQSPQSPPPMSSDHLPGWTMPSKVMKRSGDMGR